MLSTLSQQTIIQLASKVVNTILGVAIVALMTRALGTHGFGEYTTVTSYLQFFAILIDFGLTMTAGRILGEAKYDEGKLLGNFLSFRVISASIIFLLAPILSIWLPYPIELKLGIALTSLGFLASTISQSLSGVYQAKFKTHLLGLADMSARIILLAITWLAYQKSLNLNAYLIALVIANLINCVIILWQLKKFTNLSFQIDWQIWHAIWHTTWPVALTIAFNLIYFKADTLILSLVKPSADVGLYGAAYKILEVLLALPAIIGGLVLPLAARAWVQKNTVELKNLYAGTFDALLAAGLGIMAGSFVIGTPLIIWLTGAEFAISGSILMILSVACAAIFLGNASGYFIFALDKQKKLIPMYAIAALLALVGYIIFIPKYSYFGAAWVTVGVEAFMALVNIIFLWRNNLMPSLARFPKILATTLLMTLALILPLPLFSRLGLGIGVYLICLWWLKLIPRLESAK